MKKKLLTLLLAATMLVSSSVTVLAGVGSPSAVVLDDATKATAGQEIKGDGATNLPVIKVTVPSEVAFALNPFQIAYKDDEAGITSNAQIATIAQEIKNESNVAIKVNVVDAYATGSTGVNIASATTVGGKVATKSVFLWVAFAESDVEKATFNSKSPSQLVLGTSSEKKASKEGVAVLEAGTTDKPTKVAFMLHGDMVANPTVTSSSDKSVSPDPWTTEDKVSVSMKFTFEPQMVVASGQ